MRIDAHHHFWNLARGDYGWLTPDLTALYRDFGPAALQPFLEAAGIKATILVQAAPTEAETNYLLEIAQHMPWIAGVVGWTDLAAPAAPTRVARLAKMRRLVGLRPMLQDLEDPDWILRPEASDGLSAMAAHDLVFDALVREAQLPAVIQLSRRFPKLSIVLDHAGKPAVSSHPGAEWRDAMRRLADCPNVTVKFSGLLTEAPAGAGAEVIAPFFDGLLASFGPDRILWGSDWPVLTMASDYPTWVAIAEDLTGGLAPRAREAIWGGTAARVYGIEEDVK